MIHHKHINIMGIDILIRWDSNGPGHQDLVMEHYIFTSLCITKTIASHQGMPINQAQSVEIMDNIPDEMLQEFTRQVRIDYLYFVMKSLISEINLMNNK